MKKSLLLLLIFCMGAYSCSKDENESLQLTDQESISDEVLTEDRSFHQQALRGVSNNGKWLVFESKGRHSNIKRLLEIAISRYDFDRQDREIDEDK